MSQFDGNFNALMPKAAPNPCCMVPENLGPFERLPEAMPMMLDAVAARVDMVSGYRRCTVCQRRHFFTRPVPVL